MMDIKITVNNWQNNSTQSVTAIKHSEHICTYLHCDKTKIKTDEKFLISNVFTSYYLTHCVIRESITDKTHGYSSEGSTIQKLDLHSSNTVLKEYIILPATRLHVSLSNLLKSEP